MKIEEDTAEARGPARGSSPPRARQRTVNDDEAMEAAGVDASMFAQTKYLKQELKVIIQETVEDQEKKFEARFSKLERKLWRNKSRCDFCYAFKERKWSKRK